VEDYDSYIARRLVQGVDLAEPSAAPVGSKRHQRNEIGAERRINLSVLDGCAKVLTAVTPGHRRRDR
jgi:hypothetical protein